MLEKFRFNRVGLDEEKSGNMLEKLKWGAGGRRFKSSRPDQSKQALGLVLQPRPSAFCFDTENVPHNFQSLGSLGLDYNRDYFLLKPAEISPWEAVTLLITAHVACCTRTTLRNGWDTGGLEYALIQEQTKAGRAAAVARSVGVGRKLKLTPPTGGPCP